MTGLGELGPQRWPSGKQSPGAPWEQTPGPARHLAQGSIARQSSPSRTYERGDRGSSYRHCIAGIRSDGLDVGRPTLQCVAHFAGISSPVVDACDATLVPTDVVQNGLHNVRGNAKFGHASRAGAAEVVQTPRPESRQALLERCLPGAPSACSIRAEHRPIGGRALGPPGSKDRSRQGRKRYSWGRLFLVRSAPRRMTPRSRSTSLHRRPPISLRRWPVSTNRRTMSP